jgi:hypothetical protein
MTTPSQVELETSILLMLAEEARASNRRLRAEEIAAKFVPPVGGTQVQIALQHLERTGMASGNFDNPRSSGFQITRGGIVAVEDQFDRIDEGPNTSYRPKASVEAFDADELQSLADEGTYVFPVPPEVGSSTGAVPAPVVIHNHVNPIITNNNAGPSGDAEANRLAQSGARAGWTNALIAIIACVVVVAVTLWAAGKLPF